MKPMKKEVSEEELTEKDEMILSQTKPYLTGSLLCSTLAIFCLMIIGINPSEPAFWLCILTLIINSLFLVIIYRKARKITI